MEKYFVSDEFAASLSPLAELFKDDKRAMKDAIEYLVGAGLEHYMILHGVNSNSYDTNKLNSFMQRMVNYIVKNNTRDFTRYHDLDVQESKELLGDVIREMGIDVSQADEELKKKLRDIVCLAADRYDFMFHSFNGYYLDSIKENGIDPNSKEDEQELLHINGIFEKYGLNMVLGWAKYDKGTVSVSMTPSVSYHYAISSPEWFSQFTGGSTYHKGEKTPLEENNFEAAQNNVASLIDRCNMSEEDRNTVMDFFLKSWEKYANQTPMVAVIETKLPQDVIVDFARFRRTQSYYSDSIDHLFDAVLNKDIVDNRISEKIDTSNAKFVELPKYNELVQKMTYFNEQEKANRQQIYQTEQPDVVMEQPIQEDGGQFDYDTEPQVEVKEKPEDDYHEVTYGNDPDYYGDGELMFGPEPPEAAEEEYVDDGVYRSHRRGR